MKKLLSSKILYLVFIVFTVLFISACSDNSSQTEPTKKDSDSSKQKLAEYANPDFQADLQIEFSDSDNNSDQQKSFSVICPGSEKCVVLSAAINGYRIASTCKEYKDLPPDSVVSSDMKCTKQYYIEQANKPTITEKLPGNQACTMLYGGPETLTVKGTIENQPVNFERGRSDGCQISEYDFWQSLKSN
jgi:hypothetical protein